MYEKNIGMMMSDDILLRLDEFCISIKILLQHEGCKTMQMANVLLNVTFINYAKIQSGH